ncbi:MAG TPA: DNA translocase FtsK, partial [Candidatus Wallbacteria bacterium]|nr:DNA translocase FtsK [Candidatus Wallbacteria bacterium]
MASNARTSSKGPKGKTYSSNSFEPNELELKRNSELAGLTYIFSSIILLVFFILKPSESYWLGLIYNFLAWFKTKIGVTMYLFSFLLWYFGIQKFMHGSIVNKKSEWVGYAFLLFFSNLFFEMLNNSGGYMGSFFTSKLIAIIGNAGTFLVSIFGILIGVSLAFDVLLSPLFTNFATIAYNSIFGFLKFIIFGTAFAVTMVFKILAAAFQALFSRVENHEILSEPKGMRNVSEDEKAEETPQIRTIGEEIEILRKSELQAQNRDDIMIKKPVEKLRAISNSIASTFNEENAMKTVEDAPASEDAAKDEEQVNSDEKTPQPAEIKKENTVTSAEDTDKLRAALSNVTITKTYTNQDETCETPSEKNLKHLAQKRVPESASPEISYIYPDFSKILEPKEKVEEISEDELKQNAEMLVTTFKNFNIDVQIVHITQGPTVTRYEMQPAKGVKVSKIMSLIDDISLALATSSIRMEAPIPGKAAIGLEVPNSKPVPVYFADLIMSPEFTNARSPLLFALGKTITGQPIIADLKKMPHLLVAGTTGSRKSVCMNTIIASILFHA